MDKTLFKKKNTKFASRDELLQLDKNELVDKILQLEAHTKQLKNIISKNASIDTSSANKLLKKTFDFSKCHFRRVLLRVMYFGWHYQGLAVQEDSTNTIEDALFHALVKSCLVQSRDVANYHRCGRTDKGVSAFGQVISISLRSKHSIEEQDKRENIDNEMEYCKILNRLLPEDIRAISWSPIPCDKPEYSARFDCKKRLYKYYFPHGGLNVSAMNEACKFLIGSHDFRNFCKMDVGNGVTEFVREIISADILPVNEQNDIATSMYYLKIEGNAFLWHQIRCIFGVLMLIGQGKETPHIIQDLLNIEENPRKPQYNMALDVPLNLFNCYYDLKDDWIWEPNELRTVVRHLQNFWTLHNIKSTMIKDCLDALENEYKTRVRLRGTDTECDEREREVRCHAECLLQGVKPKIYQPLLKRAVCSSLEERIEYYKKKRKMYEQASA